ncbi:MAG: CAAX prenyl protease-related protein [Chthoniobacterales bacterium]
MSPKNWKPLYIAYIGPFAIFMLGLAAVGAVSWLAGDEPQQLWLKNPEYWIYPLQSLICAAFMIYYWKYYEFGSLKYWWAAVLVGLVILGVWISPQWIWGVPHRTDGFDPNVFAENPTLYWLSLLARFFRLVVVVPLLEEIFWRGFLMRYFIREKFETVPFGAVTLGSFSAVTFLFAFVHSVPDLAGAIITGVAFGLVAVYTRSLWCCVIAHAVTNLGLGLYIMQTKQWGFW